ncbi:dephospho-CoA kinase [Paenibacillus arenosi]|uniref:Dephospho-CoA kinase n=1 Tax=Paenibacillus arenosi TaxID=2774142 RepID=A0ABR9B1K3_9BACL|nr:dephospho-CoA kinase [Paenibacillus arenosi]MBD8500219.1 dephospho-CoA kinase [Paenibacillus arenosi]
MNIGLTGGIASGKSTVSQLFVQYGARLVDADRIAREVVLPGSAVLEQIAERFGSEMLLPDGTLDRKRLGEIIFQDPVERRALEQITHPAIRKQMMDQMKQYELEDPKRLVVVDVPLLYESGLDELFQEVVVVYVPASIQLERLKERDRLTEEEAYTRIRTQMSLEEKRERADWIIHNDKDRTETERQVRLFLQEKGLL